MLSWRQTVASCVTWSHKLYDYIATQVYRRIIETRLYRKLYIHNEYFDCLCPNSLYVFLLLTFKRILHISMIHSLLRFIFKNSHTYQNKNIDDSTLRYKKSLTNFTHSIGRSQRSLSRAPSLDILLSKLGH